MVCSVMMATLLAACNAEHPEPKRDMVVATVKIVDALPAPVKQGELARAKFNQGLCTIWIRRDVYPACLTHELMHCFSDSWHDGYETTAHCLE